MILEKLMILYTDTYCSKYLSIEEMEIRNFSKLFKCYGKSTEKLNSFLIKIYTLE
jgi:hypothetical protein